MQLFYRQVTDLELPMVQDWRDDNAYIEYWRHFPSILSLEVLVDSVLVFQNSTPVGMLSFQRQGRSVSFGVMILKNVPKRLHVALKACKDWVKNLFSSHGMHRLYCKVLDHRKDLKYVLHKFGFKYEGRYRESVYLKGRFYDECIYGLLAKEWEG